MFEVGGIPHVQLATQQCCVAIKLKKNVGSIDHNVLTALAYVVVFMFISLEKTRL